MHVTLDFMVDSSYLSRKCYMLWFISLFVVHLCNVETSSTRNNNDIIYGEVLRNLNILSTEKFSQQNITKQNAL